MRWDGRAIPDDLQTFLAGFIQEQVVDVTAATDDREYLPVVDLSFADVEHYHAKGGALTFVVRTAQGLLNEQLRSEEASPFNFFSLAAAPSLSCASKWTITTPLSRSIAPPLATTDCSLKHRLPQKL